MSAAVANVEGSARLADEVRRHGAAELGRRLGASEAAVRAWAKGQRSPSGSARAVMASALGIPVTAWGLSATRPTVTTGPAAGTSQRAGKISPTPTTELVTTPADTEDDQDQDTPVVVDADAKAVALETVQRLRKQLDRLDADPKSSSRERSSVATALTSATRLLARVSGSLELTPSQILRAPAWLALQRVLTDALRPVPGALDAAAKALRTFEANGGQT